jgi:hypothetical protein
MAAQAAIHDNESPVFGLRMSSVVTGQSTS